MTQEKIREKRENLDHELVQITARQDEIRAELKALMAECKHPSTKNCECPDCLMSWSPDRA